ncbi:hypothetical protein TanjilG_01060 [Lupinus angustifolius]|uniref:Uncharacterized protein n=1 Tax=Lupinus angustifolius TaxID=3871 RepID=A0A1J7HLG6_LUPAN|nr:hypothetical protein TanjilG_01060 [Lupinus angustifolius]
MRIPSKRKREFVFPASMQKLPGPGKRAILGPTKPCHEQSTQQERAGDIETKTHSVYCSNALPPTDEIASLIPIPAKLAADSTSPRVYALFVLASAIERE